MFPEARARYLAAVDSFPCEPASAISWEVLREAYLERFGPLFDADARFDFDDSLPPPVADDEEMPDQEDLGLPSFAEAWAAEVVYYELRFAAFTETDTRVVYATFGASGRTGVGGHTDP
jgi:hypothetical protein